jgi:hypothetical protein
MDFTKNKQNLIWLGIAAVAAAFFLYSGKINLPNQQLIHISGPTHSLHAA